MISFEMKTINRQASIGVFMSEQNANVEQDLNHESNSKSFEYKSKSIKKAHSKEF